MIGDYNENFDEERERKFVEEHGAIQEIYIKDGRYYLFKTLNIFYLKFLYYLTLSLAID